MTEQVNRINFISPETFEGKDFNPSEINFVDVTESVLNTANAQEKITPQYPLNFKYTTNVNLNNATYDVDYGITVTGTNYLRSSNGVNFYNGGTINADGSISLTTSYVDIPFDPTKDVIMVRPYSYTNSPEHTTNNQGSPQPGYYGIILGHYNENGNFVPVYCLAGQSLYNASTEYYRRMYICRALITGVSTTYSNSLKWSNYTNQTYTMYSPTARSSGAYELFQFVEELGSTVLHGVASFETSSYNCYRVTCTMTEAEQEAIARIDTVRFMAANNNYYGHSDINAFGVRRFGETDIHSVTDYSTFVNYPRIMPEVNPRKLVLEGAALDYELAKNKPSIEGRTLIGNMELGSLGFQIQTKTEAPLVQQERNAEGLVGVTVNSDGTFTAPYYFSSDYTGIPGCINNNEGVIYTDRVFPYSAVLIPYTLGDTIKVPNIIDKVLFGKLNEEGSITPAVLWNSGSSVGRTSDNGWHVLRQVGSTTGLYSKGNNIFVGWSAPSGVDSGTISYAEENPRENGFAVQLYDYGSETIEGRMLRDCPVDDYTGQGYWANYTSGALCLASEINVAVYIPAYQTSTTYKISNIKRVSIEGKLGVDFGSWDIMEAENLIDFNEDNFGNVLSLDYDSETLNISDGKLEVPIASQADELGLMRADSNDFTVQPDGTLRIKEGISRNDVQPFTPSYPLSFSYSTNTHINNATYDETEGITVTGINFLRSSSGVNFYNGGTINADGSVNLATSYVDIPFDIEKDVIMARPYSYTNSPEHTTNSQGSPQSGYYGILLGYYNSDGNFVPVYCLSGQSSYNTSTEAYRRMHVCRALITGLSHSYMNSLAWNNYTNQTYTTYSPTGTLVGPYELFQFVEESGSTVLHGVQTFNNFTYSHYRVTCTLTEAEQEALGNVTTVRFMAANNSYYGHSDINAFGVRRFNDVSIFSISDTSQFLTYPRVMPEESSRELILHSDTDYDALRNKPSINGVQIQGDLDLSSFGFQTVTSVSAPIKEAAVSMNNTIGLTETTGGDISASYYYNSTTTYIPLCTTTDANNVNYTDRVFPYCGVIIPYTVGQAICTPSTGDNIIFGHLNADGSIKPLCHRCYTVDGFSFPAQIRSQSGKGNNYGVNWFGGQGVGTKNNLTYRENADSGSCYQLVDNGDDTIQVRYLNTSSDTGTNGHYQTISVEYLCGFDEVDVAIWVPCAATSTLYNLNNLRCANVTGLLGTDFGISDARAEQNLLTALQLTTYTKNYSLDYDGRTLKVENGTLKVPVSTASDILGLVKPDSDYFTVQSDGTLQLKSTVSPMEVQPFTPQYPAIFEYSTNTNINNATYSWSGTTTMNNKNYVDASTAGAAYMNNGGYTYSDMSMVLSTSYVDIPFDPTQDVVHCRPYDTTNSPMYCYQTSISYYFGLIFGYKNAVGNFVPVYAVNESRYSSSYTNAPIARYLFTGVNLTQANRWTGIQYSNSSSSSYTPTGTIMNNSYIYVQFVEEDNQTKLHTVWATSGLTSTSYRRTCSLTPQEQEEIAKITTARFMANRTSGSITNAFCVRRFGNVDIHSFTDNSQFFNYPIINPAETSRELILKLSDTIPTSVGVEYYD